MNTEIDRRTAALRRLLVERSSASERLDRARTSRRTMTATIAAFTLVGALTGGAVSAVAIAATADQTPTTIDIDQMSREAVVGDARLLGIPISHTGSGDTVLRLGPAPEGATDFVYAFRCLDATTYVFYSDDDRDPSGTTTCDEEAAASPHGGGGGSQPALAGDGSHTLTIEGTGRFSIWGSWAQEPTPPEPSEFQRASLADGVVTQDEYRSGYERFATCMTEAGFPLAFVDTSPTVIDYSTSQESETDGASPRCYTREFEQVDTAWQVANQDTSETASWLAECLTAKGIAPAPTLDEKVAQLDAAGLDATDCDPTED
jgi:hypothetical protein